MKLSFSQRFLGLRKAKPAAPSVPPAASTSASNPEGGQPTAASATPPLTPPTAADHLRTGIRTAVSVAKNALKSSISLLVIVVFIVSIWALLLRLASPKPLIVVDSFEISSDMEKQAGISGKNAADVFTDELNSAATAGERFKGNDYASPHHYGRIRNVFRIPVQTTYGIQFNGISVDVLMDLYRRLRYNEWHISGDVVKSALDPNGKDAGKVDVRVRVRRSNRSERWELTSIPAAGMNGAIQKLAEIMLSREQPELMGRANLEWALTAGSTPAGTASAQEHYAQAIEDFRGWALNEPQNPLPYFYMATAYHYWPDQEQASSDLALWSQETLNDDPRYQRSRIDSAWAWVSSYVHDPAAASDTEKYAEGTEASAELEMEQWPPTLPPTSPEDYQNQRTIALDHINRGEAMLEKLVAQGSPDSDTEENLATARAHRADLLSNMQVNGGPATAGTADLQHAYADYHSAIDIMTKILREEPDSAGFHSNLSTEYLNIGRVASALGDRKVAVPKNETDQNWYRLAATQAEDSLHLYPRLTKSLIVGVDALASIELGSTDPGSEPRRISAHEERAHICRSIELIVPGSTSGVLNCRGFIQPPPPASSPGTQVKPSAKAKPPTAAVTETGLKPAKKN